MILKGVKFMHLVLHHYAWQAHQDSLRPPVRLHRTGTCPVLLQYVPVFAARVYREFKEREKRNLQPLQLICRPIPRTCYQN